MINHLAVQNFKAIPWLETSRLMDTHQKTVVFSTDRPNVIVGPNGAGKSALIESIALRFLAFLCGRSAIDGHYINGQDAQAWWENVGKWTREWAYLPGLSIDTDEGPIRYYRPNHIPGNDHSITAAMMCGYFNEAKTYAALTEDRSSGEKARAVLEEMVSMMKGEIDLPAGYLRRGWRDPLPAKQRKELWSGFEEEAIKADFLMKRAEQGAQGRPLLLMDEPEQSLDALAEARLWRTIEAADCDRMQIIVATHSLYPILHSERFHLIEATTGFVESVTELVG